MCTSSHVVLSCEHVDKLDSRVSVNIDFTTICKSDDNPTGDVPDGGTVYLCITLCLSVCVLTGMCEHLPICACLCDLMCMMCGSQAY